MLIGKSLRFLLETNSKSLIPQLFWSESPSINLNKMNCEKEYLHFM